MSSIPANVGVFFGKADKRSAGWYWVDASTKAPKGPYKPIAISNWRERSDLHRRLPRTRLRLRSRCRRALRAIFGLMRCRKQWADIDGGHFGLLYYPSEIFDQASAGQCTFLVEALSA